MSRYLNQSFIAEYSQIIFFSSAYEFLCLNCARYGHYTSLLYSVPGSYRIVIYFVSDMPSVFIGTIFALDRECEEILL